MAENLNYSGTNEMIGMCYYNDPKNCETYGKLYDWNEAMKVCPTGWHLPSREEWENLVNFSGGLENAGRNLKAKEGWRYSTNPDSYDFAALPGGKFADKAFSGISESALRGIDEFSDWWGSTENDYDNAYQLGMNSNYAKVFIFIGQKKTNSYYVRCVQGMTQPGSSSSVVPGSSSAEVSSSSSMPSSSSVELSSSSETFICDGTNYDPTKKICCNKILSPLMIEHYGKEKAQFCDSRDGKKYVYVEIGTQTWMAEDLNYGSNGCYSLYGRSYDWSTAMNVCPSGWHLPSTDEWNTLINFAGGSQTAGNKLKATSWWADNYIGIQPTDDFGFSALPGGVDCKNTFGGLRPGDEYGNWWSSSYCGVSNGRETGGLLFMGKSMSNVNLAGCELVSRLQSVRCVKD